MALANSSVAFYEHNSDFDKNMTLSVKLKGTGLRGEEIGVEYLLILPL